KRWLETIYLQTAVKTDGGSFSGPYAAYFKELIERDAGAKYFIGMPIDILQGQCKDTFTQVMNSGFPGGLMTVDQAVKTMNQGCSSSLSLPSTRSPARSSTASTSSGRAASAISSGSATSRIC